MSDPGVVSVLRYGKQACTHPCACSRAQCPDVVDACAMFQKMCVCSHKTEMELSETLMMWKTLSHLCDALDLDRETMHWASPTLTQRQDASNTQALPKHAQPSPFLQGFLQG